MSCQLEDLLGWHKTYAAAQGPVLKRAPHPEYLRLGLVLCCFVLKETFVNKGACIFMLH